MGRLPEYSETLRNRAVELVLNEGFSYSRAIEKLKEEFPNEPNIEKLSKSTIYRWVQQAKKEQKKEEEKPKKEPSEPVQNIANSIEDVKQELKKIPRITPEEVVKELNESITPVPDGPLMKEEEQKEEKQETKEEKAKSIADKLFENRTKLLWSVSLTLAVSVIAYLIYRKLTGKKKEEPKVVERVIYLPTGDSQANKFAPGPSPNEFSEPDHGFAPAEVLP